MSLSIIDRINRLCDVKHSFPLAVSLFIPDQLVHVLSKGGSSTLADSPSPGFIHNFALLSCARASVTLRVLCSQFEVKDGETPTKRDKHSTLHAAQLLCESPTSQHRLCIQTKVIIQLAPFSLDHPILTILLLH